MTDYETEVGTLATTLDGGLALEAVTRGEIDIQITTAKRYPRSIDRFLKECEALVTRDPEVAESMFYNLPRDGKRIEGPSVRLAEAVVYGWGNLRVDARIIAIDAQFITAVGTCFDLERNVASRHEVKRRITNKSGKRFSDDMIVVTGNAACSIAMREAVFKVVPRALVKQLFDKAKATAVGQSLPMATRRANAFAWFQKQGVDPARILASLGRAGMEEVTMDDLLILSGTKSAIKEGDLQLDEAFPVAGEPSDQAAAAGDRLRATAEARRAQAADGGQQSGGQKAQATTEAPTEKSGLSRAADVAEQELERMAREGFPPDAPEGEGAPLSEEQAAFIALVMDSKALNRTPFADERQRDRLRAVAEILTAGGEGKAGEKLAKLAGDAKLGKAQAGSLILKAIGAQLIDRDPAEDQADDQPQLAAADTPETLL